MCEFAATLRNIEDDITRMSGNTQVNHVTYVESTLETIEPYIVDELPILLVKDLTNAYIGFTHTNVSQRLEILDLIETKLINITLDKKISVTDSIDLLYEMS